MRYSTLFVLLATSGPAYAIDNVDPLKSNSTGQDKSGWNATVDVAAQPTFGSSLRREDTNDLIDNAEYSFGLSVDGPISDSLRFKPALTLASSPNIFDAEDVESSMTAGAKFIYSEDDDFNNLSVGYRLSLPYSGTFRQRSRTDHIVSALLDLKPFARKTNIADNPSRPEFSVGLDYVASNDKDRSRVVPTLIGQWKFSVASLKSELKLSSNVKFFTSYRLPDDKQRTDKEIQAQYLVDIGQSFFRRFPPSLSVKAGGRYERNWSDVAVYDVARWYAILSLTVKCQFKTKGT